MTHPLFRFVRGYALLYLLFVAGYIPFAAIVSVAEGAAYGRWDLDARGWSHQIGAFKALDDPWLWKSGILAAGLLYVLLERIAARQPARHLVFAAGAGVIAAVGAEGVLGALAPLVHSGAWQVQRTLLTLPVAFIGTAALYGFVGGYVVFEHDDHEPGAIGRSWYRQDPGARPVTLSMLLAFVAALCREVIELLPTDPHRELRRRRAEQYRRTLILQRFRNELRMLTEEFERSPELVEWLGPGVSVVELRELEGRYARHAERHGLTESARAPMKAALGAGWEVRD